MSVPSNSSDKDSPPVLKTWNQLYWLILIIHAAIITLFYIFTEFYK